MGDNYISQLRNGPDVVALIVLVLCYFVWIHHGIIEKIEKDHKAGSHYAEGMIGNSYASRPTTIVDSGLTSNKAMAWGNKVGQGLYNSECSATERAAGKISGFTGGYEPPVFWPIGDVETTRGSRGKGDFGTSVMEYIDVSGRARKRQALTKNGILVTDATGAAWDEVGHKYVKGTDGVWMQRCGPTLKLSDGQCVLKEGAQFVEVFEDDNFLLGASTGREGFYTY